MTGAGTDQAWRDHYLRRWSAPPAVANSCLYRSSLPCRLLTEGGIDADPRCARDPTLTRERYEEVVRRLTGGKRRIASSSDLSFEGLLVHAAGDGPNGFCVFDMFESEDAVEAFRSALGSILEDAGIAEPPRFFSAHTVNIA